MEQVAKPPSGKIIWNAMREELLLNLYPLPYTTLPPSVFHVYLHPADYDRVEGIVPRLVAELQQALTDEVRTMNHGREKSRGILSRLIQQEEAGPIEVPASGWDVHIHADRNDTLKPGHLGIESMLPLPPAAEFGGPPTVRIVKSVVTGTGRSSTTIEVAQAPAAAAEPDARERASLTYDDDQGHHVFRMRKDTISVGRGGSSVWVDVQIIASSNVSREHFRIRHDRSGRFYIQDWSSWGTSVNGERIPPSIRAPNGALQAGAERELPASAEIRLADALTMRFESRPAK